MPLEIMFAKCWLPQRVNNIYASCITLCMFTRCYNRQGLRIMNNSTTVNSLASGRSGCDFKNSIFNLVLLIGIFRSSHDNALRWMPQNLFEDSSTLVQVMAWCRQATSHYLSLCWPSSMSPYGVTRPQWVKKIRKIIHDLLWDFLPILAKVYLCTCKRCVYFGAKNI